MLGSLPRAVYLGERYEESVDIAVSLEHIAMLAYRSIQLDSSVNDIKKTLLDKNYFRKHGKDAYYGQENNLLLKYTLRKI